MISVWFACKSCGSTFSSRTVDEFLDHKKEKHFPEFKKTQCIIFEELKDDGILASVNEHLEVKLFEEDGCDVVLDLGTSTDDDDHSQIFGEIPEPSEFYDVGGYEIETEIETETLIPRSKSASKFLPVRPLPPPPPPTHQVKIKNSSLVTASSKTETKNSSSILSSFPIPIPDEEDEEHEGTQLDPFENLENADSDLEFASTKNAVLIPPPTTNPYVLIKRLTSKQLKLASKTKYKSKRDRDTPAAAKPTLVLTKKGSVGTAVVGVGQIRRRGRPPKNILGSGASVFKCPYLGCSASLKNRSALDRHETSHQNAKLNPKSRLNRPYFVFPDERQLRNPADPPSQTLREWLLEQKLAETKKSSNPDTDTGTGTDAETGTGTDTPTVNIIRLDPDPTNNLDEPIKITVKSPVKCKLCCKNLESDAEVRVHVAHCWLQNKQRHRHCVPCNKTFCEIKVFRKHHQQFHILGKKPYERKKKSDVVPMLRKYLCHLCPMSFKTSSHLQRHLETHVPQKERVKPFVCEMCGFACADKYRLKDHQGAVHSEDRPFKCPHPNCTYATKTKRDLSVHLRSHSDAKPFSCPKEGCCKSYKSKNELRIHLKGVSHTGVRMAKSWKCQVENCAAMYTVKSFLERHMIVAHGARGELPTFTCHVCNKSFPWKGSLIFHMRSHTGERPFKCTYEGCDKAYRDRNSLAEHINAKHTGERPFACELCEKSFCKRWSLKEHMVTHGKIRLKTVKKRKKKNN